MQTFIAVLGLSEWGKIPTADDPVRKKEQQQHLQSNCVCLFTKYTRHYNDLRIEKRDIRGEMSRGKGGRGMLRHLNDIHNQCKSNNQTISYAK